jgi:hypothetical protein
MLQLRSVAASVGLAFVPAVVASQSLPPVRRLVPAEAEFPKSYSQILGVRELSDGRVVIADACEKTVDLLDFARGTTTRFGREGRGPGEYQVPFIALPHLGDSTRVIDFANAQSLTYSASGAAGSTVSLISISTPDGSTLSSSLLALLNSLHGDGAGRLYRQGPDIYLVLDSGATATREVVLDSAPILRNDLARNRQDTVAYIRLPKAVPIPASNRRGSSAGTSRRSVMRPAVPFQMGPSWAVAPDGRVAIVYPNPYHIEWLSVSGSRTRGPTMTHDVVRVTEADRARLAAGPSGAGCSMHGEVRTANGQAMFGRSVGVVGPPPPGVRLVAPPPIELPEFKSPIGGPVLFGARGELYVSRSRPAGDSTAVFDVFDPTGKLSARVELPPRMSLVGVGREMAYVTRRDADNLIYLRRYRIPRD